jgi:dipeptidyl aminopeptidase/acylaminoacyl peptidase
MNASIVVDGTPYTSAVTNGLTYTDVWVTDLKTGERTEAVHKDHAGIAPSDSMRYFAYYSEKLWWVYDLKEKRARALHPDGFANFENELDDHTVPTKQPAAFPHWLDNDEGLIIHDQYDAWLANPKTGAMRRLTNGRKDKIRFRYLDTTPYEESPKLTYPMHFDALDTVTKKDGIYVLNEKGEGTLAITDDALFRRLTKAKNADRMMFTMESFQKSPDIFITNQAFTAAKPVTRLNPQQKDFHWGRTELVPFKSRFGAELNGTLIYPADYDPKKKYPMVTYIYERLSDDKNAYLYPVEWSAYNQQYFSQNGYFVFMPDIAYRGNRPGESAVDCLEPAVDAVLAKNVGVDPKHVGLIGHSWGAYQTAFVTTVSNRFAVGACGAPLTELTSMYNSFYWNAGITDQPLIETGQGRMRVPFWEDPKAYFDNSPVWQSSKRKTPLLIAQGDADGAVDFHQSQYLYNTLRRMGKNCVLLMYSGENHNFTMRPDQLDYAKRLRHWLDVYLKDAKPETWVSEGIPYTKQAGG